MTAAHLLRVAKHLHAHQLRSLARSGAVPLTHRDRVQELADAFILGFNQLLDEAATLAQPGQPRPADVETPNPMGRHPIKRAWNERREHLRELVGRIPRQRAIAYAERLGWTLEATQEILRQLVDLGHLDVERDPSDSRIKLYHTPRHVIPFQKSGVAS